MQGSEVEREDGLITAIIKEFASRFAPDGVLARASDGDEHGGKCDGELLAKLGFAKDCGKLPDVVLYCPKREWLFLIDCAASRGPIGAKRRKELARLFAGAKSGLVYVTAFPSRAAMKSHVGDLAWETVAWIADEPSHLIHFNGARFLGPYS
jgi:hypothetical protein